jgi:phenylpropionate dioxygenase-like ring-hydroxylating dioxygenase large terminal subunit
VIRNHWYALLDSKELGRRPRSCLRMGERLVFWRDREGAPHCHVDRCAHRGASFGAGAVVPCDGGDRLRCPFHGLEYDAAGRCRKIPANGAAAPVPEGFRLRGYEARELGGFVWIFWADEGVASERGPRWFDDLPARMSWSTRADPWANHYARSIENQLDMAHLPFVHGTTIGRGGETVVDGPGVVVRDGTITVYPYNRRDDGTPRRSSEEVAVPRPDRDLRLEFIFPNVWQNRISERVRVLAAFAPVDAENTVLYLRFGQSFLRAPLLSALVHAVGNRTNLVIARQDRRVVETQLPRSDGIGAGELLFPGDRAIMEYRRMRLAAKEGRWPPS